MINSEKEKQFREWMQVYADLLYTYAMQRGFGDDNAKDLVQETFMTAWRNAGSYRREVSPKNWLFIILKSRITDHYRKTASRPEIESIEKEYNDHRYFDKSDHWDKDAYPAGWHVDIDNRTETREFYNVLSKCRQKLKDIQQSVFVMKYIDDLESEEICRQLSITTANYWVIIHRAKVQLRACLQKNWIDQ